jgi:hypothetical protein
MSTKTRVPDSGTHSLSRAGLGRVDGWLSSHVDLVSLLIFATGFALRLMHNAGNYLNADEATNYLLAHQNSLLAAYKSSLGDPHPPLFVMLLYLWQHIGTSEFVLRLLPAIAGTAALWVGYRWVTLALAPVEGLVALLLLTFSPTLISLSAEVRNYSLLLLALTGSLYFLERSLRDKSSQVMVLHFVTLCIANLTNYAAVWATLAVSTYAAIRLAGEKAPARLMRLWGILQLGVAGLWAFLYVSQIRSLLGAGEQAARAGWLSSSYFHPGQDRLLPFMSRQIAALFVYLFASPATGAIAFCLLAAGIALLLTARISTADLESSLSAASARTRSYSSSRQLVSVLRLLDLSDDECGWS